jgi:UDP-perosamine 4-acetyltransferase
MIPRCVILGGGGHAKVVIEALRAEGRLDPVAIVDAAAARKGRSVFGVPIVGDDAAFPSLLGSGITLAVSGIGGVRDNTLRRNLLTKAREAGFTIAGVVHPSALVSPSAKIAPGAQVLWGAVVGPDAVVGEGALVNTRAIVEHDCRVGAYAHVATGAVLAGGVTVSDLAHVGAGAVVRQGITIGARAVVGAGAAVVKDVPEGQTVVGVPARPL